MTKASDNAFPSILITEGTEPSAPAAGKQRLYIDSTTHKLKRTDSSGVDVTIESASSGGVATDPIFDAAGDLPQGTGSDAAARLAAGTLGHFLMAGGAAAALSWKARELDYVENTSAGAPTATTEATANTMVTGNAVAYDGSTIITVEFYCETLRPRIDGTAGSISLWLYDGSSSIGRIALASKADAVASGFGGPCHVFRRLTPSNASHTYSIRASVTGGTGSVSAGAGGSGQPMPMFIRITRAI